MSEKKISVIIPVYKVEKFIHACVTSVLQQTYENLEVILVDDGSPDQCPAICDQYAAQDDRVRVIHQENQGVSVARNTGIAAACGDYVMYLDSDVAYINDTPITLDAPATLMNNRTMVPLRFVMEAFNVTVDWNGDTRTVEITK